MATSPYQFPTTSVKQSCDIKSKVFRPSSISYTWNNKQKDWRQLVKGVNVLDRWYFKLFKSQFTLQPLQYKFLKSKFRSHHQIQPSLHPCSAEIHHSWDSAGGWHELWRTPCSPLDECEAQKAAHHHHPNRHPEGIETCKKWMQVPDLYFIWNTCEILREFMCSVINKWLPGIFFIYHIKLRKKLFSLHKQW